uniref:Uncharacterized protein n=1 Tax=Strongyloides stercoralis TaxID=6248 RepID=A0A0K0E9P4_STRER
MESHYNFWRNLGAFTILFTCQTIFIINFWSNQWFVANVSGENSTKYTLLIGFNSNCIKSDYNVKPHCTSLSDNGDFLEDYGIEFLISKQLLSLLYTGKFMYYLIMITHLLMTIGIIKACQNFESNQGLLSDTIFVLASIIDFITKIILSTLLISGYGCEVIVNHNEDKIYLEFGFALILYAILLIMIIVVNILMLDSFIKTGKKYLHNGRKEYIINTEKKEFFLKTYNQ